MLTAEEAKRLVDRIGPSLGYDLTYEPMFPPGRQDIAVVDRLVENGSSYGFDIVYAVWKKPDGELAYRKLIDTQSSKDYIRIDEVLVENGRIIVKVSSGGSYSGKPWKKVLTLDLSALGLPT